MIKIYKILFLLSFLIVLPELSFSNNINENSFPTDSTRNYLNIAKRNNNRVLAFRTGEKITVFAKGLKFKGRIKSVTSDKIYIDNFPPIYLADIEKIKVKSTLFIILGVVLIAWGAEYMIGGLAIAVIIPGAEIPGLILSAIGGSIIYWGIDVFNGKNYKFRMWKFESSSKYIENSNINFIDE